MARIIASGNIITDLSQIPSSEFALKELIKNSYEAFASEVNINLIDNDFKNTKLVIKDDGKGMSIKNINLLLNLSRSTKKFGSIINERYISGEKGLGFFSVFKFGKKVSVQTFDSNSSITHTFCINLAKLIDLPNISAYEIPISDKHIPQFKGTEITIENLDQEVIEIFKKLMNDPGESSRLVNMIYDEHFQINLSINNNKVVNNVEPENDFKKAKIAEFRYNSLNNKMNYNNKFQIIYKNKIYYYDIPEKYKHLLTLDGFQIKIAIQVYKLGVKKGIKVIDAPKLFYFTNKQKINPLLYINNAIFNDDNIYNVEINSRKSSKHVFRQQIGFLFIYLQNNNILKFNADRTQILENQNYLDLIEFTNYLSSNFQKNLRDLLTDKLDKNNVNTKSINNNHSITDSGNSIIDEKNVKIALSYKINDLIPLRDPNKFQKVDLNFIPNKSIKLESNKTKVAFYSSGKYDLEIKYKVKINQELKTDNYKINVLNNKQKNISSKQLYIESFIEESEYLDNKISLFRNEINKLYWKEDFDMVFVSSLRTFVELVVQKIASITDTKVNNKKGLNNLLNRITKEETVEENFLNNIENKWLKQGINSAFNDFKERQSKKSIINVLNVYTHSGVKFLSKKKSEDLKTSINFLFSYLNSVTDEFSKN